MGITKYDTLIFQLNQCEGMILTKEMIQNIMNHVYPPVKQSPKIDLPEDESSPYIDFGFPVDESRLNDCISEAYDDGDDARGIGYMG